MKPVFTLAMLGLLACGLSACQPDNSQAKKSSPPAVTITTAPLSQRPLEARIGSLASIEAVNSPQVLAEVAGRVAAVAVDVGTQVKPGQLLLTLDPADLRNSKLAQDAEVARLGALADQQRRNVVRYRDLLTQGFISDAKMDELVAQQQAIEQQWAAAKAQAANSQRMVDKAQVRAPVAGAIDTRLVNVGEYVTVGKPLFTLASGGALRDHVLGATLLNGRGELLRFGGSVMKNVAGFDVSRLLAGSMGTLGMLVDVTLKVMPVAADTLTLRFECGEVDALESLARSASKPWPIDASAWWDGMLLLRLRGARAEVQTAARKLGGDVIPPPASDQFWAGLRDQQDEFFTKARAAVAAGNGRVGLWRLSVPSTAPALGVPGEQLIEWGGALRWVCTALKPEQLRERVASVGGHATLFVGHPGTRATALVHSALPAPLDRIHRELKRAFDPAGIFNRGRLFDDRVGSDHPRER